MLRQKDNTRLRKAHKITTILRDYLGDQLTDSLCLDLGSASGIITRAVQDEIGLVIGTDIDGEALAQAPVATLVQTPLVHSDGVHLPFPDDCFDVVICAQVYEHTYDQEGLAVEVWRILRPGGVCFFSGPNRLAVIEEHYWLPFLSWLPQKAADGYLRLTERGTYYDIKPMLPWRLRRLWHRFQVIDYTPYLFSEPVRMGVDDELGRLLWVRKLPFWFWKIMTPLLPNFNWILVKSDG